MDENILKGLDSAGDRLAQQKAIQYFEQLKESPEGWVVCAENLTSKTTQNSDHAQFFCLQVIEHFLKNRYAHSSTDGQQKMKSLLLGLIQIQAMTNEQQKTFIRNKIAQLFALAFIADFPQRWITFFDDLLHMFRLGDRAIDMYLRVLMAIDCEVVDREIVLARQENSRNAALKDAMRINCVDQMVNSWYHIITTFKESNPELVCSCLNVIGAYVSWIEITLIANDKFVSVLLQFMDKPLLQESACDCIHEIISKGMDPVAKTTLIESFMSVLIQAGTFNVKEDDDGDFLAKVSKLVNGVGLNLIAAWQRLAKSGDAENAKVCIDAMEAKVPLMLKYLAHEDDDVSSAVSKFAHDYLSLLKQIKLISSKQKENVKGLLYVIIQKMKYDDSYCFDQEGEDEAMFQEYRKELKIILNNLGALDYGFFSSQFQTRRTENKNKMPKKITGGQKKYGKASKFEINFNNACNYK